MLGEGLHARLGGTDLGREVLGDEHDAQRPFAAGKRPLRQGALERLLDRGATGQRPRADSAAPLLHRSLKVRAVERIDVVEQARYRVAGQHPLAAAGSELGAQRRVGG